METLTREQKRMALADFRSDDIGPKGDPWGTGMSHMFAIADTLSYADSVPHTWEYRQGISGDHVQGVIDCGQETEHEDCQCDYQQIGYVPYLDAGELGLSMLTYAGNVINRYLDWVKRAGRDY